MGTLYKIQHLITQHKINQPNLFMIGNDIWQDANFVGLIANEAVAIFIDFAFGEVCF